MQIATLHHWLLVYASKKCTKLWKSRFSTRSWLNLKCPTTVDLRLKTPNKTATTPIIIIIILGDMFWKMLTALLVSEGGNQILCNLQHKEGEGVALYPGVLETVVAASEGRTGWKTRGRNEATHGRPVSCSARLTPFSCTEISTQKRIYPPPPPQLTRWWRRKSLALSETSKQRSDGKGCLQAQRGSI